MVLATTMEDEVVRAEVDHEVGVVAEGACQTAILVVDVEAMAAHIAAAVVDSVAMAVVAVVTEVSCRSGCGFCGFLF